METDPVQSVVGINTWVAHRNKQVFGDDAEVFSPERWLIDDAASLSKLNQYWMPVCLSIYMHSIYSSIITHSDKLGISSV